MVNVIHLGGKFVLKYEMGDRSQKMKEQNPETVELLEPSNARIIAEPSKWAQYGSTKSNETWKQQKGVNKTKTVKEECH